MGFLFGFSQNDEKEEVTGIVNANEADDAVDEEEIVEAGTEGAGDTKADRYDGTTLSDVFVNYDPLHMRGYGTVHFIETRKYLQQVRDQKRTVEMLEKRIGYRKDAGLNTEWNEKELVDAKEHLKQTIAAVADEIGKLTDVNQQVVMMKRYIDVMTWDDIAMDADLSMRTVQKCHGKALPRMEEILLSDGLITLDESSTDD